MRCDQINELLSPYIDEMTDEKENKLIEVHLADCSECRQELESLKLMCGFLKDLNHPVIPERFNDDLRKRLLEEKTVFFTAKDVKRPKRSGWIAAVVAGLAITIGIYASSILPLGTIVASLEDKSKEQPAKYNVAIEDIIRSIKGWNTEKNDETPDVDIANNNSDVTQTPSSNDLTTSDPEEVGDPNQELEEPVVITPKFTNEYTTKLKVADLTEASDKLIQIAEASGAEYVLSNSSKVQALSTGNAKEYSLIVDKAKSQNLIKQLSVIGEISPAVHNQIELTEEYTDLEEQILTAERLIKDLENADNLNEARSKQLEELKEHLSKWNDQKAQLLEQENIVTLIIYLEEEVIHQ